MLKTLFAAVIFLLVSSTNLFVATWTSFAISVSSEASDKKGAHLFAHKGFLPRKTKYYFVLPLSNDSEEILNYKIETHFSVYGNLPRF